MKKSLSYIWTFILIILWLQVLNSCLPSDDFKTAANFEPRTSVDGWEISDAVSEGFDAGQLQDIYDMMFAGDQYITSRSLLIVKNGKLVSESYFRSSNDVSRKDNIKGITKCITSVLVGFAWDQELFDMENRLYDYIPGYFDGNPDKRDITVEHILTMRTGLDWDNKKNTIDLFNPKRFPNSLRVVMSKPLINPAGTEFFCNYGTPQIMMGLLREIFDAGSTNPLISTLFDPLGINDFVWEKHTDGLHYGGTGLHLTPRDLARFGQFCLQNGYWNGQQLVSERWMEISTGSVLGPDITGTVMHYGYYWWVDHGNDAFFGMGAGGQFLYIVPSKDLVVVHTANPSVGSGYKGISLDDFLHLADMIMAALE